MPRAICTVPACGLPVHGRGLCNTHYRRWYKHGDPLTALGTSRGEPLAWLLAQLTAMPTECTEWKYSPDRHGYGQLRLDNKLWRVDVLVCTWYHGPRPPRLEVCHSCGNGARGCFTPAHLRWDTHAANQRDLSRHYRERNQP